MSKVNGLMMGFDDGPWWWVLIWFWMMTRISQFFSLDFHRWTVRVRHDSPWQSVWVSQAKRAGDFGAVLGACRERLERQRRNFSHCFGGSVHPEGVSSVETRCGRGRSGGFAIKTAGIPGTVGLLRARAPVDPSSSWLYATWPYDATVDWLID